MRLSARDKRPMLLWVLWSLKISIDSGKFFGLYPTPDIFPPHPLARSRCAATHQRRIFCPGRVPPVMPGGRRTTLKMLCNGKVGRRLKQLTCSIALTRVISLQFSLIFSVLFENKAH